MTQITNFNPSKAKFTTIETSIYGFHRNGYVGNMTTGKKVKYLPDGSNILRRLLHLNTDYSSMKTPKGLPYRVWNQMSVEERIVYVDYNMEVDHIIPKSKGGSDRLINLQWLTRKENSSKGGNIE
tara:strand:- start:397 stop:771 length:375 start_codon:yes stop_codon:yes gene_type:complete